MNAQLTLQFRPERARRSPCRTSFYKTTPLDGLEMVEAIARAQHQDEMVLAVFRAAPPRPRAPSEVEGLLRACDQSLLLTSVRRSITTLTNARLLVKTNSTAMGRYGSVEHLWKLRE